MVQSVPLPGQQVVYPSSDGQPMAESDFQRKWLTYGVDALSAYFQDREDVYVSGNLFIYYEEGKPQSVVAPDVFVVMGAPKGDRSSYRLWQEPKAPDFVMEITSRSTRAEDQGSKRGLYAFLGVSEYYQYDPTGDYLVPQLQGLRLVGDNYMPISPTPLPHNGLGLTSEILGLELRLEQGELRFYEPITQQPLLTLAESLQARQDAEMARQDAEMARQDAEMARQDAEMARQDAEMARQDAEARAEQEAVARQAAEARIAELEARLRSQEEL